MKTKLKLETRKCECEFCKTSREITRIGKLLPREEAEILDGIFNAMLENHEAIKMDLDWAESRIVDIYIAAARAHNKYDPERTKEQMCEEARNNRTKAKT